jgi:hypothetical protein
MSNLVTTPLFSPEALPAENDHMKMVLPRTAHTMVSDLRGSLWLVATKTNQMIQESKKYHSRLWPGIEWFGVILMPCLMANFLFLLRLTFTLFVAKR